ncbi:diguanylate cyclase [Geomonas sp. Red32]|uniref:sensor domain-containing diguanylate cyclase n=1 Tax=Geomonas sp. Red32 TaxID=2912856 RepID=UPI00202CD488|nr:diguanylate cyclase [Geomonas sp. Red32]MCM0084180.1 diguanylate cyclase [Geomonas sp. Red32]
MDLSKTSYRQIIHSLSDGLYILDKNRSIVYWNQAAEEISGYQAEDVVCHRCSENLLCHVDEEGRNLCLHGCPVTAALRDGCSHKADIFVRHKNGHRVPVSVRVSPLTDDFGEIIGAVEIFSDLSNKLASEQRVKELEKMAMVDRLTRLANRYFVEKELEAFFEERDRYGHTFGILFMDLDDFKVVNDRFGHDAGDSVLRFVADTLTANSRPFDVYGRWGGEEFVGIVRNVNAHDLMQMGTRLLNLVSESFIPMNEERLRVTVSIGATLANPDDSIVSLMQRADALMYKSKAGGKNRLTMG